MNVDRAGKGSAENKKKRKKETASGSFSDNDFDVATRSILLKAVKKARKDKTPVSVPFLLQEITNSMR